MDVHGEPVEGEVQARDAFRLGSAGHVVLARIGVVERDLVLHGCRKAHGPTRLDLLHCLHHLRRCEVVECTAPVFPTPSSRAP
jgi:hypothetical protein